MARFEAESPFPSRDTWNRIAADRLNRAIPGRRTGSRGRRPGVEGRWFEGGEHVAVGRQPVPAGGGYDGVAEPGRTRRGRWPPHSGARTDDGTAPRGPRQHASPVSRLDEETGFPAGACDQFSRPFASA